MKLTSLAVLCGFCISILFILFLTFTTTLAYYLFYHHWLSITRHCEEFVKLWFFRGDNNGNLKQQWYCVTWFVVYQVNSSSPYQTCSLSFFLSFFLVSNAHALNEQSTGYASENIISWQKWSKRLHWQCFVVSVLVLYFFSFEHSRESWHTVYFITTDWL